MHRSALPLALFLLLGVPAILLGVDKHGIGASSDWQWGLWSNGHARSTVAGSRSNSDYWTVWGASGQALTLDYDVALRRGSLVVLVSRSWDLSADPLLYLSFEQPAKQRATVRLPKTGSYTIFLSTVYFGGRYDIRWSVR